MFIAQMFVKLGQVFTVELVENPTTGYQWELDVTDGLEIVSDKYVPSTGMPGSGGKHVWSIRATEIGPQVVYGVYMRSWEPYTGKEKHYMERVSVV